jgi:hypothetical protein
VGIRGGSAKQFYYSSCAVNRRDPTCAYYEYRVSFALSGVYLANVIFFAPTTLVQVGGQLSFDVEGLGDVTAPVPKLPESSVTWANQVADRDAMPIFDTALSQTVRRRFPSSTVLFSRPLSLARACSLSLSLSLSPLLPSDTHHRLLPLPRDNSCRPTRERPIGQR